MNLSANSLGAKLRGAREAAELSTRAAAREATRLGLPISHATLANYERGDSMPAVPTLNLLAKIYACSIDRLLGTAPTLSGVHYRALKSVRVRERRQFEGEGTRWIYLYIELENILNKHLTPRSVKARANEDAAQLAQRVRKDQGLGDKPIPSVIRLLETYGVRVIQLQSEARIDGFAAMFGELPVVALNPEVPSDRFRFNAGHELGHLLYEDWRCDDNGYRHGEDRAQNFASHLLMPDSVLRHAFKGMSMVRLVRYKELFGISLSAMIYRARQLRLLTKSQYEVLWKEFGRLGWRKREPGFVAPDYSSRLEQLIEQAVTEKKMTYGDVARLAAVDERVVHSRVLEAIGGRLPSVHQPTAPIGFVGRK